MITKKEAIDLLNTRGRVYNEPINTDSSLARLIYFIGFGFSNSLPDIKELRGIKNRLYHLGEVGRNTTIRPRFVASKPWNIHILEDVFINYDCTFLANDPIIIDRGVAIGPGTHIYTINHRREGKCLLSEKSPVIIEEGSWIGGGSIILPGVRVAKFSTIGAGSIVTHSTEEGGTYVGSPARRIK